MGFWIVLMFIPLIAAVKKECPGGSFACPDSATCCQLPNKSYGCCPLENAVCCDDHIHCCPLNTKCSAGMCVQSTNRSTEIYLLRYNDVICPDESTCPEDTTCCKNSVANFSCCPMENAVCCDDGLHCCPTNTICNLEERKCDGDGFIAQMYNWNKKSPKLQEPDTTFSMLRLKKESSVVCPGAKSQCPNGYTCCKMPSGDWGCCPFAKASCCKDGVHCCPENMHCDSTSQYCSQGLKNVTSLRNKPAKNIAVGDTCPDQSTCEGDETCCKISDADYGCCQYANATCCGDFKSCCPSHEVCDIKHRRCIPKENLVLNFLK